MANILYIARFFQYGWPFYNIMHERVNVVLDYCSIDWDYYLEIDEQNIVYLIDVFLNKISTLLDSYPPFKKANKYELKITT